MELTFLWPLIFLALVPVIIILYLLKQKGEEVKIPSTLLWREALKNMEATTPWEKYKHNILMYLQILTLLLLIGALVGPIIKHLGSDNDNVILVIDNSASMNTIYDKDVTRLDEAKKRALSYVDELDPKTSVSVVSAAKGGVIEGSSLNSKRAIKAAIKSVEKTELAADATDAMDLVRSIIEDQPETDVNIFTDTAVDLEGVKAQVISLYKENVNYSVDSLSYTVNEDSTITALSNVTNHADQSVSFDVGLYVDEELITIQNVSLEGLETKSVYFENVKVSGEVLETKIEINDSLADDNVAGALLSESGGKRVLLVTSGNTFLEKALLSIGGLEVFKSTDTEVVGKQEEYDLYIFDSCVPKEDVKSGNVIYINPPQSESLGTGRTKESSALKVLNTDITEYLDGEEILVTKSTIFNRPLYAKSFLESDGECVGYYGMSDAGKVVCLGFDIHASDVALKADFPILMYNMVSYSLERGIVDTSAVKTGEKVNIISMGSDEPVVILRPDGKKDKFDVAVSRKTYDKVDITGYYKVSVKDDNGEVTDGFYASFPTDTESGVAKATSVNNLVEGKDVSVKGGKSAKKYVIFALVLMLIIEWIVYVREY